MPKPEGILLAANLANEIDLARRPFAHHCTCGHRENIVPPCGKGEIYWVCICGQAWKLKFAGEGVTCFEVLQKGIG